MNFWSGQGQNTKFGCDWIGLEASLLPQLLHYLREKVDNQEVNSKGIKKCHPLSRKPLPPSAKGYPWKDDVGTSRLLDYNLKRWGQEAHACQKNILANDVPISPNLKIGAWYSPPRSKKQNNRTKLSDLQRVLASASVLIRNIIWSGFWLSHCNFCSVLCRPGPYAELCSLWSHLADVLLSWLPSIQ